jgi:hypothetical protein
MRDDLTIEEADRRGVCPHCRSIFFPPAYGGGRGCPDCGHYVPAPGGNLEVPKDG